MDCEITIQSLLLRYTITVFSFVVGAIAPNKRHGKSVKGGYLWSVLKGSLTKVGAKYQAKLNATGVVDSPEKIPLDENTIMMEAKNALFDLEKDVRDPILSATKNNYHQNNFSVKTSNIRETETTKAEGNIEVTSDFDLSNKKHVYRKCSVTLHSQTGSLDALRVPEVRNDVETDTDLSSYQENGKHMSLLY